MHCLPWLLKSMFFEKILNEGAPKVPAGRWKNFKKALLLAFKVLMEPPKHTFELVLFSILEYYAPPGVRTHQQVRSVHVGHCSEQIGFVSMLKMQGIRVIKVPTAARKNDVLTNKILMKSRKILVNWMESLLWNPWARKYLIGTTIPHSWNSG